MYLTKNFDYQAFLLSLLLSFLPFFNLFLPFSPSFFLSICLFYFPSSSQTCIIFEWWIFYFLCAKFFSSKKIRNRTILWKMVEKEKSRNEEITSTILHISFNEIVNNKTLFLIQIAHPSWSKSIKTFFALIIISSLDIFVIY